MAQAARSGINLVKMANEAKAEKSATKGKSGVAPTVHLAKLGLVVMIDAVTKALKAIKTGLETEVETTAMETYFYPVGIKLGKAPDNIKGTDGLYEASVQLKRNGNALSKETAETLATYGISTANCGVPAHLRINPIYIGNTPEAQAVLHQLQAMLNKHGKTLPSDLIEAQEAAESTYLTETSLDEVFGLKTETGRPDKKAIRSLLPLLTTFSIVPKKRELDASAFKQVIDLLKAKKNAAAV